MVYVCNKACYKNGVTSYFASNSFLSKIMGFSIVGGFCVHSSAYTTHAYMVIKCTFTQVFCVQNIFKRYII